MLGFKRCLFLPLTQVRPFPVYPALHEHVYEPGVFWQTALTSQSWSSEAHSSKSINIQNKLSINSVALSSSSSSSSRSHSCSRRDVARIFSEVRTIPQMPLKPPPPPPNIPKGEVTVLKPKRFHCI